MKKLVLVRHGETDDHLAEKYCGFSDPALNKKGRWQSGILAAKLKDAGVKAIYSSDLKRAYETASLVFKGQAIEIKPELREMNFGIFEGLNHAEIMAKYSELYRQWIDNPLKIRIPAGESLGDLLKRVSGVLSAILSRNKEDVIALVTHAGPIRAILSGILKISPRDFWKVKQDIAAYSVIGYSGKLEPHVIKINEKGNL